MRGSFRNISLKCQSPNLDRSSEYALKRSIRYSKLVVSVLLCQKFWCDLKICRMEIQNASTTPSKSNKLRNVNTVRWETRNITTKPGEIDYRKSKGIAFVVNAGMNVTVNNMNINSTATYWMLEKNKTLCIRTHYRTEVKHRHLAILFIKYLNLLL